MKKLFTVIVVALFLLVGSVVLANDNTPKEIRCPDGVTYNIENLYKTILPTDFPKELLYIPCCTKVALSFVPVFYFPGTYICVMTYSGGMADETGWSVFRSIIKKDNSILFKYVAVVEYVRETNTHTVLWVSDLASKDLKKYIHDLVFEINKRAGVISDL